MEKNMNDEVLQTVEEAMAEIMTQKECMCKIMESLKSIEAVAKTLYLATLSLQGITMASILGTAR